MDKPYLYDLSGHGQESYKTISQLSGIAVDNKNKIQYSSAQHYLVNLEIYLNLSYEINHMKLPKPRLFHSWDSATAVTLPHT